MSDEFEPPVPEERGAMEPPRRRPPWAVGLGGGRPPQRPHVPRLRRGLLVGLYARLYALALLPLTLGVGYVWLGRSLSTRALGVGLIVVAPMILIPVAWIHSGAASRWSLWRKRRWLLRRQRELTRESRPSA